MKELQLLSCTLGNTFNKHINAILHLKDLKMTVETWIPGKGWDKKFSKMKKP